MASDYDQALRTLYQGPRDTFVSERKRLSAGLKASGDREGAAKLAKLGRPSLSAWVVNQLWWRSQSAFERLFETAKALRAGKLQQAPAHRKALTELTALARGLLDEQGHGEGDALARRVTMTLSALAATGGFQPDAPGTLTRDRDPPGFEAFGIDSSAPTHTPSSDGEATEVEPAPTREPHRHSRKDPVPPTKDSGAARKGAAADGKRVREAEREEARRAREVAQAEAKRARELEAAAARAEKERAQRVARRREAERALEELEEELREREREQNQLRQALSRAEREQAHTLERVTRARAKLAELSETD